MTELEKLTLAVCEVAKRAGSFIRNERTQFHVESVERKHAHDYVSYVDKQSEQLIVGALRQLLPEAGFITEEGTAGTLGAPASGQPCWVIDPLDGTTNFIHGFPPFAVSIALIQDRQILLGVIYEICADECFFAWQGGGAFLKTTDGKTSSINVKASNLNDSLLCFQLPYNSEAYNPIARSLIHQFYGRVASIRMLGSAAIALCYVAAGRLDAYAEKYIGQWDFMAGAIIVSEAGGQVTDYEGSSDFIQGNSIVATNGIIHHDILDGIRNTLTR